MPFGFAVLALLAAHDAAAQREITPVTEAVLRNPDPADWLMWRRTLDSWGYSPLDEIDRGNVAKLTLAWSVDLDAAPSQEGIPLVHDGVLYFPSPSDVTTAFDAATGAKLWEHRRALPADLGQFVPFPQTNRNLAIYDRLIIDNGADDFVYALDAATGRQVWETKILDYKIHHVKQGSAPLVANGVLILARLQRTRRPDGLILPILAAFYALVSLYFEGPLYLYYAVGLSLVGVLWLGTTSSFVPRSAWATLAGALSLVAVIFHAGQSRLRTPTEILQGRRVSDPWAAGLSGRGRAEFPVRAPPATW